MGRLFTYMVKAAAGQQPAPGPEYYQFRKHNSPNKGRGIPYKPSLWNATAAHFGHLTLAGQARDLAQQAQFAKRMYDASSSSDADAFFGINGAADYATALNSNFTSPAAIYDYLEKRPEYQAALRQLADNGSYEGLSRIWAKAGDAPGMTDPTWGWRSDYQLSGGAGNAQLIMNMYLAEEARRKKAANEAQPQQASAPAQQPAAPQPAATATQPTAQPAAAAPKPATTPVQAPAIPVGTSAVTGQDGKQYISSNAGRKAQTAAGIGAALEAGQNPFAGAGTTAPGASSPTRANMNAGQDAVRNKINSNIASGQSMYGNMGDSGKFMTESQRSAMNAAKPYESSGLRMVGHSADGSTQTYVGRSGRGRITVGTDATAGHYRGAGAADTNTRTNYKDLRARTARPVQTPAAPAASRKTSNTTR